MPAAVALVWLQPERGGLGPADGGDHEWEEQAAQHEAGLVVLAPIRNANV
jgi:hypothetical protein